MGKYNKKKRVLLLWLAIMTAAAMALAGCSSDKMTGDGSQKDQLQQTQSSGEEAGVPTDPAGQGLILESVAQEEDRMVVTTSYGRLYFPFAFSDVIRVCTAEQTEPETLLFSAYLEETEYPLFSIVFGSAEGIPVGTLTPEDGTALSVTAHIFSADEGMEPGMQQTFYAAQESVNDVIGSLADIEGFVPAQ